MLRPRIYISGPITSGDRNHHVYVSQKWQKLLMENGFAPLNPIHTCVLPFAWEPGMTHDMWIACDLPWIEVSDAVLRLPGYSKGADQETEHAFQSGLPVFFLGESDASETVMLKELIEWKTNTFLKQG